MVSNSVSWLEHAKRGFALDALGYRQKTGQSLTEKALISELVSEMRRLIRPTETLKWSPPFELVIVDDRGCVAFRCEVRWDGKVRPLGQFLKFHTLPFPSHSFLTARSL